MTQKIIEIRNLYFSYPDGKEALNNISFNVFERESLGIVGPNGAGKSTLFLHLNGLLRGKGSIKICGLDMQDSNLLAIRKKVGLVFQNPDNQLFMPTVFDDVAFGPINLRLSKEEVTATVTEALKEVNMLEVAKRAAHHLSFGEKKKITIATVTAMKPEILVLDEPSSNLDPKGRRDLIKYIKNIKTTKVIATHDLDLVGDVCDRIILLDNGRLITQGSVLDILCDKRLLETHGLEVPLSLSHRP